MQAYFLCAIVFTIVAKGSCFLGPHRWVPNKTSFLSAPASKILRANSPPATGHFRGKKLSVRCFSSPMPVSFTVTVNPTSCETYGHQSSRRCGDLNCDIIPALMAEISSLKDIVNKSDSALKTLQERIYENEKMDIVAELAHIYKERIVCYTLKYHNINDTDYRWEHLVVFGEDSLEARMLETAKQLYKSMDPELITEVDFFMEVHPVPVTVRPMDSTFFVEVACKKARKFKFKENDPHKLLVDRLCTVIERHREGNWIPTGEELLTGPAWAAGDMED